MLLTFPLAQEGNRICCFGAASKSVFEEIAFLRWHLAYCLPLLAFGGPNLGHGFSACPRTPNRLIWFRAAGRSPLPPPLGSVRPVTVPAGVEHDPHEAWHSVSFCPLCVKASFNCLGRQCRHPGIPEISYPTGNLNIYTNWNLKLATMNVPVPHRILTRPYSDYR